MGRPFIVKVVSKRCTSQVCSHFRGRNLAPWSRPAAEEAGACLLPPSRPRAPLRLWGKSTKMEGEDARGEAVRSLRREVRRPRTTVVSRK